MIGIYIAIIAFIIIGSILLITKKKKNKQCPKCSTKYTSNDIVEDFTLVRVVGDYGVGSADVRCLMKCPKCGHERYVTITVNAPFGGNTKVKDLEHNVYKYFDK